MVYIFTAEPSVSFWDCGEYIATAYKLQVGHPPGAPTFQLVGRIASLFAGGDVTKVAFTINCMSAVCSGFTILFLFWSITMLGRKLATAKGGQLNDAHVISIFGSGVVGALAYTFSDTFWFSAVEGEVYAMSSMFTAIVFWAILKWEQVAETNYSNRWIILIGYLIGLSIGVHLLNLLTVPAMALIVYFKKYTPTTKKTILALLISFLIVAVILWGIIPGIVKYSGFVERLFTNSFHTGFHVGTIVFFVIIAAALTWGIRYSEKKKKRLLNLGLISLVFLLIGYSTFLMLPIRANANVPIAQNDPEDAVSLLSYLNRDQYGSHPLVYGQYYNTPVRNYKDGNPVYVKKYIVSDERIGRLNAFYSRFDAQKFIDTQKQSNPSQNLSIQERYEISDDKKQFERVYDGNYCGLFPRMWSQDPDRIREYRNWAGIGDDSKKITFSQNMKFFINYQMLYMYWRYFLWNFVGRQTLEQGRGTNVSGEWICGIKAIDESRVGPQDMPKGMKSKAYNKYFFLPLILGLVGLFYHFKRDKNNAWVIFVLYFMTGAAIGIYLNMEAYQPRERDYAFAASFYAFSIWLGMGVYAIAHIVSRYLNKTAAATLSTVACMGVPVLMGTQNWDDHDRSQRYLVREIAKSYLDACAPNAILFANGDNDTFPLWYMQEVEGYRTDVRICNLSLMSMDWYVEQINRKIYEGEPVPFSMTKDQYKGGMRDITVTHTYNKAPQDINHTMDEILSPKNNVYTAHVGANNFYMDIDKEAVLANKVVDAKYADRIVDRMYWSVPDRTMQSQGRDTIRYFTKAYLAMLDIIRSNNWKRPIYFVGVTGNEPFFGMEHYTQIEGIVHRLVPVYSEFEHGIAYPPFFGLLNTDIMYDNLINRYRLEQYAADDIFLTEDYTRLVNSAFKIYYGRLANALLAENKTDSAEKVLDKCYQNFPIEKFPSYDAFYGDDFDAAQCYFSCNTRQSIEKGLKLSHTAVDQLIEQLTYINKFPTPKREAYQQTVSFGMQKLRYAHQMLTSVQAVLDEARKSELQAVIDKITPYMG
jgi:hypothetical protein